MDLFDIFEDDDLNNNWFDTFLKNEFSENEISDTAELNVQVQPSSEISCNREIDPSSDDNLTWNDLTFELADDNAWFTPQSEPRNQIIDIRGDLINYETKEMNNNLINYETKEMNNNIIIYDSNEIEITQNTTDNNSMKNSLKRKISCEGDYQLIHKRQSNNQYETTLQQQHTTTTQQSDQFDNVFNQHEDLIILSNGEMYRRVNENELIDITLSGNNETQMQSPSASSDSGFSLDSPGSPTFHPSLPNSENSQLSAYTLSQALFTDPQPRVGILILTDEEKMCLTSHGHPIPSLLPLDKDELKYLKKIRRKIKNKIAAQESRRRRKEYTDTLETQMKQYQSENIALLEKVTNLEKYNRNLLNQMKMFSGRVRLTHPTKGKACFMVLALFFAMFIGSWDLTSWNIGYSKTLTSSNQEVHFMGNPILGPNLPKLERMLKEQKVLSHGPIVEHPLVENYFDVKGGFADTKHNEAYSDISLNTATMETEADEHCNKSTPTKVNQRKSDVICHHGCNDLNSIVGFN